MDLDLGLQNDLCAGGCSHYRTEKPTSVGGLRCGIGGASLSWRCPSPLAAQSLSLMPSCSLLRLCSGSRWRRGGRGTPGCGAA